MTTLRPRFSKQVSSPAAPSAGRGVFLVVIAIVFSGIASHSLWTPDEPVGAAIGRAMLESRDGVVPRLNGAPFLEKPPLYWWVQVPFLRVFGLSAGSARLPSALFSCLTLFVTYRLGRRIGGPRAGMVSLLVLGTTALFAEDASRAVVDPALMLFVTLTHSGFVVFADPRGPAERRRGAWTIGVASALAFLSKGWIALALGVLPPTLYLVFRHRRRGLRSLGELPWIALPLFAFLATPWVVALWWKMGWSAVGESLFSNLFGRFLATNAGRVYGHRQPFWYYLPAIAFMLLPWSLTLPGLFRRAQARRNEEPEGKGSGLLLFTFSIGVVVLSLAASKRELYLLPLLPAFAISVAGWLEETRRLDGAGDPWSRRLHAAIAYGGSLVLLLFAVLAFSAPWIVRNRWPGLSAVDSLSTAWLVASGILALALGSWLLWTWFRASSPEASPLSPEALALPFAVVFLLAQTTAKAWVEPLKSLGDMIGAVAKTLPGEMPVPFFASPRAPSESVIGIIQFNLGRRVLLLASPREVEGFFARHPGSGVLFRVQDLRTLPPGLRRHLIPVYDETGRKASPFAIATWSRRALEADRP